MAGFSPGTDDDSFVEELARESERERKRQTRERERKRARERMKSLYDAEQVMESNGSLCAQFTNFQTKSERERDRERERGK